MKRLTSRERYEQAMLANGDTTIFFLAKNENGSYRYRSAAFMWEGWQLREAQMRKRKGK